MVADPLAIDPSHFHRSNVTDTCAVWNVLSSKILYSAARQAGCDFCVTGFVQYECLGKERSRPTPEQFELTARLKAEQAKGSFAVYSCAIEDLQEVAVLENRQNLGKGELSSIAFAKKIGQAVLTDDQKARKLSEDVGAKHTQTTPHLLSWLVFTVQLGDADVQAVIDQSRSMGQNLEPHFRKAYDQALICRLNSVAKGS